MDEVKAQPDTDYAKRAALYAKLRAVMADVQYIQKNAKNDFHGYKYASEAAIKGALHKAFVEHGIIFLLSVLDVQEREAAPTKNGKAQWITRAILEYEFTDTDSGYSVTKTFAGQGIDGEDKGLYKAITGGLKYALTSAFLIETGDDPEGETDQGQRVNAARQRSIDRVAAKVGEGAKGYDKKKATLMIGREIDRLKELVGEEEGVRRIGVIYREHNWSPTLLDDQEAARELFKAFAAAVLEAGDEQSDANPDPAQRKSEPKQQAQAGKFAYLEDFAALKKEVGDTRYYTLLGSHGYEKSSLIPVKDRAAVLQKVRDEISLGV